MSVSDWEGRYIFEPSLGVGYVERYLKGSHKLFVHFVGDPLGKQTLVSSMDCTFLRSVECPSCEKKSYRLPDDYVCFRCRIV